MSNVIISFRYSPRAIGYIHPSIMPRKYVRKGQKQLDRTNLEAAFNHRVESGCSMKVAAEKFGVKKTTLVVSLKIKNFIFLIVLSVGLAQAIFNAYICRLPRRYP